MSTNDRLAIFERLESEVRSYCRSFPILFAKGRGARLYDADGGEYIDFLAGAGTLNYGHNNPHLKSKLLAYIEEDGLVHGLDMSSEAKRDFLDTFERLILKPREFEYKIQFTGPTGTNAVEAAFKLARRYTGRHNIVSFTNGFHGMTLGSVSATGNSTYRDATGVPLDNTTFMPYDKYLGDEFDTLEYLEKMLTDTSSGLDIPAAVVVETVQGEGGINVGGFKWLNGLERICRENEILLIIDDIQVGCGRTGTFFSFEEAGVMPDMITLSKSLSGFGLPMSVVLMKPELDVWEPGEHTGTFRGNNLAFVTAAEALRQYWSDSSFSRTIREKSVLLKERLNAVHEKYPLFNEVRGRGMIYGCECKDPEQGGHIVAEAFKRNLIIETSGSEGQVVKFLMPLTIETDLMNEGLDRFEEAVAAVADESSTSDSDLSEAKS